MQETLELGTLKISTKAGNFSQEELIQRLDITEAELQRVLRELYEIRQIKITD